ncbi:sigma-70 family RNA polymerase sigma factor [Rubritalea tangerina]|uniref:Sigma-70 family RNA polymerase sigma factor n=1 Tax=Rubritalea tangerina TaxID=430798 RepID=A0ABW4ZE47_9BACT
MSSSEYPLMIARQQEKLLSYIVSLVGDVDDAWDILQETNLILWKKQSELPEVQNFDAWTYTIAKFQTLRFLKTCKRRRVSYLNNELMEVMAQDAVEVLDERPERLKALAECSKQLKDKSQLVLGLFYKKKQSVRGITQETGIKESAVKQILARSRKALYQCIEKKLQSPQV